MSVARTPWMGCVTLSDTNAHRLSDLIAALPATQQPDCMSKVGPPRCAYLIVGNDIDNGAAKLYLGNENLTAAFFGAKLVSSQFVPYFNMDSNLIRLDHIWVLTDTNPTVVTINILTR